LNIFLKNHTFKIDVANNMVTKLETPEELESPYFKIQSTLEPHNLVEASKIILQAVNKEPKLTYSYCLEVLFKDDKAFFTL
jgi:hypothetical protein